MSNKKFLNNILIIIFFLVLVFIFLNYNIERRRLIEVKTKDNISMNKKNTIEANVKILYSNKNAISETFLNTNKAGLEFTEPIKTENKIFNGELIDLANGVLINEDGIILTNNHILDTGNSNYKIIFHGSKYNLELLESNFDKDIAIFKIIKDDIKLKFPYLKIAKNTDLKAKQKVFINKNNQVKAGEIIARDISINLGTRKLNNLIQTNLPIKEGDSGSALFNQDYELIAINTAFDNTEKNTSFAIPIYSIIDIINKYK